MSRGVAAATALALAIIIGLVVATNPTHRAVRAGGTARRVVPTTYPATGHPLRGLAVTSTSVGLVDAGRPIAGDGGMLAVQRDLPTVLWSPTGSGPFPLVVFVHGYNRGPADYTRFVAELASSGYVVAAPSFPQEDPARGYPLDRSHLADEAGDVSFVVTSLEQRAAALRLAPGAVAVVGHSDGADVALLAGYGPGTVDPRADGVVAVAPDPMPTGPVTSAVPLLLVQGTADSVVPNASGAHVFAQIRTPVVYLSLTGADHLAPIVGDSRWTSVLDDAVARFLDAAVAHRGTATDPLATVVVVPPLGTVQTRP